MQGSLIVVLNDGERYTDISGCKIMLLTDEQVKRVDMDVITPAVLAGEEYEDVSTFHLDNPDQLRDLADLLELRQKY